jgi:hypothetical protein
MAAKKKATATKTKARTKREALAMIEPVRVAGAAALAAFESSFLENGSSGVGLDGSATKMLKGDSGMQKVVKLSGDGGTYRAVVKVIFRERKTRAKARSRKAR